MFFKKKLLSELRLTSHLTSIFCCLKHVSLPSISPSILPSCSRALPGMVTPSTRKWVVNSSSAGAAGAAVLPQTRWPATEKSDTVTDFPTLSSNSRCSLMPSSGGWVRLGYCLIKRSARCTRSSVCLEGGGQTGCVSTVELLLGYFLLSNNPFMWKRLSNNDSNLSFFIAAIWFLKTMFLATGVLPVE